MAQEERFGSPQIPCFQLGSSLWGLTVLQNREPEQDGGVSPMGRRCCLTTFLALVLVGANGQKDFSC